MRQVDGEAAEAAASVSAYMPSYNTTTAGRLRRIRHQRGISPLKGNGAAAAAAAAASADASAEEASLRQRRCPMSQSRVATESSKTSVQPECTTGSRPNRESFSGASHAVNSSTIREVGKGSTEKLTSIRQLFLRPPNGANVPPRLSGYEKYVRDCIRRHRETSSSGGGGRATRIVDSTKNTVSSASNGIRSLSNADFTKADESLFELSSESAQSSNGLTDLVRNNVGSAAMSKSTSASALDSVLFIASSDEFEDKDAGGGTETAVKEWDVLKQPEEIHRPPRFKPGASIEDMRRAVSGTKKSSRARRTPQSASSIDGEYMTNLNMLGRLATPSNASSTTSLMFAQSLSLSAELKANQPVNLGRSRAGRTSATQRLSGPP